MKRRNALFLFLGCMAAAMIFGAIVSEASYQFSKDAGRNTPEQFDLVIPAGTADRVTAGEKTPSLPENMSFVQGDVIAVTNQDSVSHQLGPLWVLPGKTGKLTLEQASSYSMQCSFEPSKYLNLDVKPLPSLMTRLLGATSVGVPSGVLVWLYALVIYSDRKKGPAKVSAAK
jgi:hypothetical protein